MSKFLSKIFNVFNGGINSKTDEVCEHHEKQNEDKHVEIKLPNLKFSIWKKIEETVIYKNNCREILGYKELCLITFYDENEIFYSGERMFVQPVLDKHNPNLIMDYKIVNSNEEFSYFEYKSEQTIMEAIKTIKNRVLSSKCLEVKNIYQNVDI